MRDSARLRTIWEVSWAHDLIKTGFKGTDTDTKNVASGLFHQNTSPNALIYTLSRFEYKFEFSEIFEFAVDPQCGPPPPTGAAFFFKLEQIESLTFMVLL
jgi:hypothetical protein